jgi:hypothetical protein
MNFLIGDYWVTINGNDMLIDISPKNDGSLCVVRFVPAIDEIWILG